MWRWRGLGFTLDAMTHARSGFSSLVLIILVWFSGCAGDGNPDVANHSGGNGNGGNGGGSGGKSDSGSPDGSKPDAGDGSIVDAPLAPVRVGIVPIVRAQDGGTSATDETLAHLEVLAAGSRGVSLVRRWDS